jgi:hypothetical protein
LKGVIRIMEKQPEDIRDNFIFTEKHDAAIKWLFTNIVTWFDSDKKLFLDLFYNRHEEIRQLTGMLTNAKEACEQKNILITGSAGIGKTSFLCRIIGDAALCDSMGIKPILVDYSASIPLDWTGCLYGFVSMAEKAFQEIGHQINTLKPNHQEQHIDANIHLIRKHLEYLKTQGAPHIVIILDDFDYANTVWFKLLDYFIPFAAKSPASVVLSVRPPLKAAIEGYDNRFSLHFTRDVNVFDLKPLGVEDVIASRLAPLLEKKETENWFTSIINNFKKPSVVEQLRRKLNITESDELSEFEYPLTEMHNNFMRKITNGDLRETFDIAYDSICFVLKNRKNLEKREEFGHIRYIIGHENTLQLFCDREGSKYKIMDLHKRRSKKGKNSLWYNVLEAVLIFKVIDEVNFYDTLKSFGHIASAVDRAITELKDKNNRLIEPVKISVPKAKPEGYSDDEYILTEKGKYYLEIAKWPGYIKRFGDYGRSLKEEYKS